jgi:hypothetical protein
VCDFGAEFVAMKNGIDTCRGLGYKLRMMGVTILEWHGSTYYDVHGDNTCMLLFTTPTVHRPVSVLNKELFKLCTIYDREKQNAELENFSILRYEPPKSIT